ncbi:MAG: hypothetical protein JXQ75_12010 [Phycisphaerae bacterium]|nr:hypothetical protein [Phycisphaerae bacterium]
MEPRTIEIKNAREHNLASVSLSLPRNSLIVFTGVSGSGKSSMAFDTLYAEGQRRYIESLSSYARQFMGQMQKPDCDLITGLSPAIAIQQKTAGWNPRSTVGTITGIHDFLRVLYARVGTQHCTVCGRRISAQSREQIVEGVLSAFGPGHAVGSMEGAVGTGRQAASGTPSSPWQNCGTGVSPVVFTVRNGVSEPLSSLPPRAAGTRSVSNRHEAAGDTRVLILAPVARGQKGEFRDLFDDLIRAGYVRARVDGQVVELREDLALQKNQRHDIEVVIDRLVVATSARSRLAEAVENALRVGKGTLIVAVVDEAGRAKRGPGTGDTGGLAVGGRVTGSSGPRSLQPSDPREKVFSSKYACGHCSISFEPPTPQLFSFNSPTGMCLTCNGLGELFDFVPELLVPDPSLNFWAPCIAPMRTKIGKWRRHVYQGVAKAVGFDLSRPWKDLSKKAREAMLYGTGDRHITFEWRWSGGVWKHGGTFAGVIEELREKYRKAKASFVREYYEKFMRRGPCPDCGGARLNKQALAVRLSIKAAETGRSRGRGRERIHGPAVHGPATHGPAIHGPAAQSSGPNMQALCAMSVAGAYETIERLSLSPVQQIVAEEVLKEIRARLGFLLNVGLHYLTLDRTAPTLSGGELQRIRLAGQIGSGLVGVLYILDEPSIGLHARDNRQLLDSLEKLRDMGNTVIVVEHDEATMRAADHIVDFGPGPGVRGGNVVASGTMRDIVRTETSLTGRYLKGIEEIAVPKRRPVRGRPGSR